MTEKTTYNFDEYIRQGESDKRQRAENWQIHPFGEVNTRTTAVFTIKYLRSLGFEVDNSLFADNSWYFRNALVRANYQNLKKGVNRETVFLVLFFRNLLLDEKNELKNRYCHIHWKEVEGRVKNKYPTSTRQVPDRLWPSSEQVAKLIQTIGDGKLSVKEMFGKIGLKDRENFLNNYLTPAIQTGFVSMLYPDSPRQPRQKYMLTIKGLALLTQIRISE